MLVGVIFVCKEYIDSKDRESLKEHLCDAVVWQGYWDKEYEKIYIIEFIAEICPLTDTVDLEKNEYISLFQTSSAALKKYAPKCQTLYSFSLNDIEKGIEYFPSDYYADITGFIVYSKENKNILYSVLQTEKAYAYFKDKTDIIISRFAVSHFSTDNPTYESAFTSKFIEDYYSYISKNMDKVSAIIYSNKYIYVNLPYLKYANDYRITSLNELGKAYK